MSEHDWRDISQRLLAEFPPDAIKTRPGGGGRQLSYIDARDVESRLDEVVGAENWTDEYALFNEPEKAVLCRLTVCGVTKTGIGYPNSDRDEEPYKAAESDALKRAAVKFGIGRHLYSIRPERHTAAAPAKPPPAKPAPRATPRPQSPATPTNAAPPKAQNRPQGHAGLVAVNRNLINELSRISKVPVADVEPALIARAGARMGANLAGAELTDLAEDALEAVYDETVKALEKLTAGSPA